IKDASTYKSTTTVEKEKEPRKEEFSSTKHLLYTETVLERPAPAKPATKVKRVYEKATRTGTGPLAGGKGPAYHGKTVLIEKNVGTARLSKLYKKDGRQYGVIDGTFAEGTMKGTAEFGGTSTVRMPNVPTVTSVSTGTSNVEDTWKELPRK